MLFNNIPVSATCVKVTSWSAPRAITAASAKNKSENSNAVVPNAAPSEASGTKAVEAVIVVALNVLAPTIVPETSKFPLTSIKVELISTSSSALISKSPSAGEPILIALSLNCITLAAFNNNPVSATWVKVTSSSSPKLIQRHLLKTNH